MNEITIRLDVPLSGETHASLGEYAKKQKQSKRSAAASILTTFLGHYSEYIQKQEKTKKKS